VNEPARRTDLAQGFLGSGEGGFMRPDWVMCGAPQPGGVGVRLIASKSLSFAELRYEARYQDIILEDPLPHDIGRRILTWQDLSLTVHMMPMRNGDVIILDGPDYPTVIEALFKEWSPTPSKAIEGS
jgi:hypothetical protein